MPTAAVLANVSTANVSKANVISKGEFKLYHFPAEIIEHICRQADSLETLLNFYIAMKFQGDIQSTIRYVLERTTLPFDIPSIARIPASDLSQLPDGLVYQFIDNLKLSFWSVGNLLQDHRQYFDTPGKITWSKHQHKEVGHVRNNPYILKILQKQTVINTLKTPIYNLYEGYTLLNLQELFFHPIYQNSEHTLRQYPEIMRKNKEVFLKVCKKIPIINLIEYLDKLNRYLDVYDKIANSYAGEKESQYTVNSTKDAVQVVETAISHFVVEKNINKKDLYALFDERGISIPINMRIKLAFV